MSLWKRITLVLLVAVVIAGHIGLWMSPDWPTDLKLKLTILNAIGWAVIILPAFAVARWAATHKSD